MTKSTKRLIVLGIVVVCCAGFLIVRTQVHKTHRERRSVPDSYPFVQVLRHEKNSVPRVAKLIAVEQAVYSLAANFGKNDCDVGDFSKPVKKIVAPLNDPIDLEKEALMAYSIWYMGYLDEGERISPAFEALYWECVWKLAKMRTPEAKDALHELKMCSAGLDGGPGEIMDDAVDYQLGQTRDNFTGKVTTLPDSHH